METLLEWARGPVFLFSFIFMILGLARHLVLTTRQIIRARRAAGDKNYPARQIFTATLKWAFPVDKLGVRPLYSLTSLLFHIAILIVPLFLAGHIALWARGAGLSWPAISNGTADILTILAVLTAAALFVQRLAAHATRALSRLGDYLLPLVVALPFATGFLVMHPALNPFSFNAVFFMHVISADVLMILIPVTKMAHVVLVPGVQWVSEIGWHWPSDAGSKTAADLGKEGVRI